MKKIDLWTLAEHYNRVELGEEKIDDDKKSYLAYLNHYIHKIDKDPMVLESLRESIDKEKAFFRRTMSDLSNVDYQNQRARLDVIQKIVDELKGIPLDGVTKEITKQDVARAVNFFNTNKIEPNKDDVKIERTSIEREVNEKITINYK